MACSCVCVEATSGRCASGPFCVSTRCWVPALGVLHVRCCVQSVMVGRGGGDWGWGEGVLDAYIATHEWWCQMNMVGARECQILCVVLLHQQESFVCHIPSGCDVWVDWLEERSEIAIRGFGRCQCAGGVSSSTPQGGTVGARQVHHTPAMPCQHAGLPALPANRGYSLSRQAQKPLHRHLHRQQRQPGPSAAAHQQQLLLLAYVWKKWVGHWPWHDQCMLLQLLTSNELCS